MESVGEGVGKLPGSGTIKTFNHTAFKLLKTCPLCGCETVPGVYNAAFQAVMYICRCTYRWTEKSEQAAEGVQTAGNDEA